MNLILTLHGGDEQRVLVNWDNVCYVESRGADGEDLYARVHFNGTAGVGAMSIDVAEDIDDIASLLEDEGEAVVEVGEEAGEDENEDDGKG